MIDTIDMDTAENSVSPEVHQELRQKELMDIIEDNIKSQYQHFENLGQNYLLMFETEIRNGDLVEILNNLVAYVNKNLISIMDLDNLNGCNERLVTAGRYIYEFICVDCYASLIPALMEMLNITSVEELDSLINNQYLNSPGKFKEDFLNVVRMTLEQILKLQSITPEVKKDENYQRLLGKYFYYQELVEYGDTSMFLENFIRPVISKYRSDLIWKLL